MIKTVRKYFLVPLMILLGTSGAYIVNSHSRLFVDPFIFDDTLENRSPELEQFLQEAELAAASAFDGVSNLAVATPCVNGQADTFPCNNIDLLAFVPKAQMGGGSANTNDIWGWTDPLSGQEIALLGRTNGTSFVDVSDPTVPRHLGFLPSHNGGSSSWRDIKVFSNHAFIVADAQSTHGLQVFDLRQLRTVTQPQTFSETAHFGGFGSAHNIVINEDTGFAYAVGSDTCSGGLYTVDISDPVNPQFAGCFAGDGYTHDAQCVVYTGPDSTYFNREICFGYNEDTLTIVDVQNKSNPVMISRTPYAGSAYTHQGWVTPDQRFAISNDELDEQRRGVNTTTFIWDLNDLDNPFVLTRHTHATPAIDHNLYIHDGHVYESNYRAGLRILSTENIASGTLEEVGFFDVIPGSDSAQFSGTWSNYPYFDSGTIILSDIGTGLFVVKANLNGTPPPPPPPPPPTATCEFIENFDDATGFGFVADQQSPQYSSGSISGGAANAVVGGVDNADITDMEAVWRRTCTAADATGASITVIASMDQAANYESNEFSQIALRVNGGRTVFATLTGNGNGGGTQTTGTQTFTANVSLTAGENTIDLVCFNNLKTFNDESTSCSFESVTSAFGGGGSTTVFEDDFEAASGWVTDPNGTDAATTGQWERANPQATTSNGPKQLGTTVSGSFDLVTAGAAGSSVGTNDIDNGVTSVRSPDIAIPASGNVNLSFSYYMAHTRNSSNADFFRVSVVTTAGSSVVLEERGAANDDDAAWEGFSTSLNAFSGQVIHLLLEAADAGNGSIVEAAIDDLQITAQ